MATHDWVKSLRADIRGDCEKGWNLRGREVGGKMVMQIDRNAFIIYELNYHGT